MERIRKLCRILCIISVLLLVLVGSGTWFVESSYSTKAYDHLKQQVYEIQLAINDADQEEAALFAQDCFEQDYQEDQLREMITPWISKVADDRTYSQETIDDITKEMISLYKKQKEIASDPIHTKLRDWCCMICTAVLIVSIVIYGIIWRIDKGRKRKKQQEQGPTQVLKEGEGQKEADSVETK